MATISGANLPTARVFAKATGSLKTRSVRLNRPWHRSGRFAVLRVRAPPVQAAPDKISEKVEESIKKAEEACDGDALSGECAAAWDEVEELSAAASHARDRVKESDALEDYCKDNPEVKECRTYDS